MVRWANRTHFSICILPFILVFLVACASKYNVSENYHDPNVDFALLRTVAVMPFANLTSDRLAAERKGAQYVYEQPLFDRCALCDSRRRGRAGDFTSRN